MPILGVFLSKCLADLTLPYEMWSSVFTEGDDMMSRIKVYSLLIAFCSVGTLVFTFGNKYIFGSMGATLTLKIREVLYINILTKHMGWFDERDNSSGVLTSTLAADASLIQGASSESLGP